MRINSEQKDVDSAADSSSARGSTSKPKTARPVGVYVPVHRRKRAAEAAGNSVISIDTRTQTARDVSATRQQDTKLGLGRNRANENSQKLGADVPGKQKEPPVAVNVSFGKLCAEGVVNNTAVDGADREAATAEHGRNFAKSEDELCKLEETQTDDTFGERLEALQLSPVGDAEINKGGEPAPPSDDDEPADWEKILDTDEEEEPHATKDSPSETEDDSQPSSTGDYVDGEPTRSLEVYDFPSALRTHHIREFFHEYDNIPRGGFKVHWINDTSCVLEFNTAAIARRAYLEKLTHKMFSVRPYRYVIPTNDNHPDRKLRPVTTDMVARRLVQGALGIRTQAPKESAHFEKEKIRRAREEKEEEQRNQALREEQLERAFFDG